MGTALTQLTPASTFDNLLQLSSGSLDGSFRNIEDGLGVGSPLQLSTSGVNIVSGFQVSGISVTASAVELNYCDRGYPLGIVEPLRAVVADAFGNIQGSGIRLDKTLLGGSYSVYRELGDTLSSGQIIAGSGEVQSIRLIGSPVVITFSADSFTNSAAFVKVIVNQDTTGSRLVSWGAEVSWPGGTPPVLTTTPSGVDIFEFFTKDLGTEWFGRTYGLNY